MNIINTNFTKLLPFVIISGLFTMPANCKKGPEVEKGQGIEVGETGAVKVTDPAMMPVEQKYYSPAKPGPWEDHMISHTPLVSAHINKATNSWIIKATVAFDDKGKDYIENIILINHLNQELEKKLFPPGTRSTEVTFKRKVKNGEKLFVIAKCNMHDTWQEPVKEPEK